MRLAFQYLAKLRKPLEISGQWSEARFTRNVLVGGLALAVLIPSLLLSIDKGQRIRKSSSSPGSSRSTGSHQGDATQSDGAEWRGRPSTNKEVCCRAMGNPWTGSECLFQNQHQVDVYHQCVGD